MASRLLHLSILTRLAKRHPFKDSQRLFFGAILPDAPRSGAANSHFRILCDGGRKKTLDLTRFRSQFLSSIENDDLYLGYYLHLIQDLVFRKFIYGDLHWNPAVPGNVERLYNDYRLLNRPVIERHSLPDAIVPPERFDEEPLQQQFQFDAEQLLRDYRSDFILAGTGESFFFTPARAEAYLDMATAVCDHEMEAVRNRAPLLDEYAYAYRVEPLQPHSTASCIFLPNSP